MTPYASPSADELSWYRRFPEEVALQLERLEAGMPFAETVERMRRTGILGGHNIPLRGGVRLAWTSGEVQRGLAKWFGHPPSKVTVLRALDHLRAHGLIRREWRGRQRGRPVYRFVRPLRDEDARDLPGRRPFRGSG